MYYILEYDSTRILCRSGLIIYTIITGSIIGYCLAYIKKPKNIIQDKEASLLFRQKEGLTKILFHIILSSQTTSYCNNDPSLQRFLGICSFDLHRAILVIRGHDLVFNSLDQDYENNYLG